MGKTQVKEGSIFEKLHFGKAPVVAEGTFKASRGKGVLNYIFWLFVRIPVTSTEKNVVIQVKETSGGKVWHRRFGSKYFITHAQLEGNIFKEKIGGLEFIYRIKRHNNEWEYEFVKLKLLRLPIPKVLSVDFKATSKQVDVNSWIFDIKMCSPLGGEVFRYWGKVNIQ